MTAADIDFLEDTKVPALGDNSLKRVSALAQELLDLDNEIGALTTLLEEKQKERRRIAEHTLPELLDEIGLSDFTLTDGRKLCVQSQVFASIPSKTAIDKERDPVVKAAMRERTLAAFTWLERNGYGALISREVKAKFKKGEGSLATKAIEALGELGMTAVSDLSVHPATLSAFVKEQLANGREDLPFDLLNIHQARITKIVK